MKNFNFRLILIAFLLGVTIFSVSRYTISLKEKYDLLKSLESAKKQAIALETEKQNLLQELDKGRAVRVRLAQENLRLKDNLKASKDRLTKLFTDFGKVQKIIGQLDSQNSLLKAEITALREEKGSLQLERDDLKQRMSSLSELKQAIRDLKTKMRRKKTETKMKIEPEEIIEGNCGFLIKDGQSTYPSLKVKIEVVPLSPKE